MMMTRTPDEIKKGLNDPIPVHFHIGDPEPRLTPLAMVDLEELHADALALIQQLEATVSEKEKVIAELSGKIGQLEADNKLLQDAVDQWELVAASPGAVEDMARAYGELVEKVEQLQAERDALYEEVRRCFYCIHVDGVLGECNQCCESCEADCPCKECDHYNKFEWRGVTKEE